MARREGRLRVDHPTERLGDQVEPVVVREDNALGGLERGDVRGDVGRRDALPEGGVPGDVLEQVGERGVEPGAAAAAHDVGGGLRPTGREEHLGGLGKPHDPAERGDLVAAEAGGLAAPVPVLVGRRHRDDRRVGEREQAQDLRAAVAAQPDQLVAEASAASRHGRDPAQA